MATRTKRRKTGTSGAGRPKSVAQRAGSRGRTPGRPRLDGSDQQALLLDAALACYVRRGIGATSIRDVATEAGVTPALVHYYFGDAKKLQEEVLQKRLMPAFFMVRDAVLGGEGGGTMSLVTNFVNAVCAAIEAHPWFPSLWVREVVSEGGALRDVLITRVAPELTQAIGRRFALAQGQGKLNRDLDPRLLITSLIGLTLFPAAGAPIWRRIFNADDLTMDDVRTHALALLARGLEAK